MHISFPENGVLRFPVLGGYRYRRNEKRNDFSLHWQASCPSGNLTIAFIKKIQDLIKR